MYHENTEVHIEAILHSPDAPQALVKLQNRLEQERQRREQFYADIDDDMKVEFINGEVIVQSPVKKEHTDVTGALYALLRPFVYLAQLGYVGYEKVMTTFTRNDYEPDVVFFGSEKAADIKKGQWKYPPPDFVVEVLSEGTESRDRGVKFKDYEDHGVQEYWIIDPETESIEQYFLQNGMFKLQLKISHGTIESRVIKGFSMDVRAIFDEKEHLEALRKILAA